jgi:hypothetical protein
MSTSPALSSRIDGIDLARWLAIAGMLAVHVGRVGRDEPAGQVYLALTHGRASVLFALLAGVGASLLARSRSTTRLEARARLVWQAALLLPLGLALQGLDITIRVIIAHYAVLFLLGAACLSLRDRTIAGLALVSVVFGPLVFLIGPHGGPRDLQPRGGRDRRRATRHRARAAAVGLLPVHHLGGAVPRRHAAWPARPRERAAPRGAGDRWLCAGARGGAPRLSTRGGDRYAGGAVGLAAPDRQRAAQPDAALAHRLDRLGPARARGRARGRRPARARSPGRWSPPARWR